MSEDGDNDDFDLIRGSGNLFADLGMPNAEMEQLRARLAAGIIRTLDADGLTVREAHKRTGVAAADFSRIRQAKLDRFTIDRLMTILDRLGRDVKVDVSIVARPPALVELRPAH